MTSPTVRASRKELRSGDVLDKLDDGKRVIIEVRVAGITTEVALRRTDGKYVCDTGFKLLTYKDRADMRSCIERLRLTIPD